MIMKRLLTGIIALLMLATLGASAATLRVGMEANYAPFNWTQPNETEFSVPLAAGGFADGYDVQIALLIAKGLGMELEVVKTEWDGLPLSLTSGKIDAIIAGMSPTEERKLVIDFTDPYYESDLVIVVKKDGPFAQATSLKDFEGARITAQLNTFHYSVIEQIPGVDKQTALETFTAMIVALASGRIDGYVSERPGALSAMISNPEFTFAAFGEGQGFETLAEDTTVAVGLQKGSTLTEKINAILAGISKEDRIAMMDAAMTRQPLSE
jgi:putative lysine transport system substrate-binding protein